MDKLPEDININEFYEYSNDISEGAAPFLLYDPGFSHSYKLIKRIERIYDF